ncbi:MAG: F0F1 ATP synthase subunit B [Bacteroidales bacterium]|nr:F0F1 ATP synthase subunit B [Bacteroidales bacterium]
MDSALITPGLGVIFWMVVSFAILVFILLKFGWPIILKTLNERESAINDALLAADKAKEEMQQLKASNEDLLREAKMERDEMLRNARLTSEKIIEDSKIKATEEADRIVEMARQSIEYEKMEALHELKNQMANLSIEIAEKLLKQELADKERANAFIKQELEDVNLK